jgi:hypothetical protein
MIFLSAVSAITACKPSDQHVRTVRERLEAGEAVEFTKPGTKTANCGPAVWTTIKVSNKIERDRVILGQQASILNAGYKFCGVIGKPVDMTVFKGDTGLGQVIVTKITLVKLDKLKKSQLKGAFFSEEQGFEDYKAGVRLYPENQGVVTIIDTRYQKGTAVDEKAVINRDAEKRASDGYVETKEDGTDLSNCSSAWYDLAVAEPFQEAVVSGRLGSWYSLGDRNCIRQGSTINVKSKVGKDEPAVGKVKVAKIKKFRVNFLEARYFDLREQDFSPIEEQIRKENTRRNEWITVVDFVASGDKTAQPAEIKQVTITEDQIRNSEDVTATVVGKVEFKAGELLVVNVVNKDFSVTKASATVIESVYAEGNDMTFVKIHLLKGVAP